MSGKLQVAIVALLLMMCSTSCWAEKVRELSFQLDGGMRVDSLDWNIAGPVINGVFTPNILSELEWDDLEIYQLSVATKLIVENNKVPFATYIRLKGNYGWIVDGDVQDSDYMGDNRTLEFSRSYSDSGDGDVIDLSAGLGFQFDFFNNRLLIAPLVGYSYSEQNLTMKDGHQVVSRLDLDPRVPDLGQIYGLDSSYETEWSGIWFGVDVTWLITEKLYFEGSVEYHDVNYEAEADWNLRSDLAQPVSFVHEADGDGLVIEMALRYLLNDSWALNAGVSYSRFETDSGPSIFYYSEGGSGVTKLNEVNWESFSSMIGVRYDFF